MKSLKKKEKGKFTHILSQEERKKEAFFGGEKKEIVIKTKNGMRMSVCKWKVCRGGRFAKNRSYCLSAKKGERLGEKLLNERKDMGSV